MSSSTSPGTCRYNICRWLWILPGFWILTVEPDLIHGLGEGGESREFHVVGHFFLADCATCIFFLYKDINHFFQPKFI
jgi:hypothetical protein